ncbi:hypothetical protein DCO48_18115 [Pseudomonas sp. SDI]|uniref:DUF4225 domain-containing protein n=1 Tax=Pseudomonas sp. SDI TaxID=2170734 RepID=UPI000DE61EEE|nr:DUF4225 domain-containing protein [Pseudomonas sp. SDI]PWB31085.1 hypothetical protein DCO48_18115 [Pseudomonas sp. SDI]
MTPRPSPYRLDNDDYWVVCEAANNLTKQACTLGSQHLQDGMLQLQFTREIAYFTKSLVNDVEAGRKTPEEAVLAMKMEQRSLLDQSSTATRQGAAAIAGALQIASGVGACYASAMTLCLGIGLPLIAHGINNVYEGGRNLWEGRSDTEGPVRKGYQSAAKALGGDAHDGNIAYGTVDIGLSIYGIGKLVVKPDTWRLFRYINSDYIRNYRAMGSASLMLESHVNLESGKQIYKETKK